MRCVKWLYTWCSHFTCWCTIPLCWKSLSCAILVTYKFYPQLVTMRDYNRRQVCTTVFSKRRRSFIASISGMIEKNFGSNRKTMRNVDKWKVLEFFQAWERLILALHLPQQYSCQIVEESCYLTVRSPTTSTCLLVMSGLSSQQHVQSLSIQWQTQEVSQVDWMLQR